MVHAEVTGCAGHGICFVICPEAFEPDDDGFALVTASEFSEDLTDKLVEAEANCPERAIEISRQG